LISKSRLPIWEGGFSVVDPARRPPPRTAGFIPAFIHSFILHRKRGRLAHVADRAKAPGFSAKDTGIDLVAYLADKTQVRADIHRSRGPWTAAACCRFRIRSLLRIPASRLARKSGSKLPQSKENQQLTTLRDWLLPMLMNSQVQDG
jgi:hypothetical protein